ncbi:MAG: hypothetical protein DMD46_12885 [Gemmatimonadetes bacterium]|nr:MAG: hypothetical protein DMD46_12885 [Gemmatimonadota bacterium]
MTVRAFRLTATGLLALGACRGGSGGPKVTLRYHPRAGTAYHYALDQQNTMSVEGGPMGALGEQAFRMRLFYTQTVVGPAQGAEGGVAVTVTFDSTAMEASGMGTGAMQPALDRMRGMTSNLVYDDRMRVISAAFTGPAGAPSPVTDQMASSLKSMAFPLPEGPVGVGDTWVTEHELPLGRLSPGQPIKSRTRLTVKEIRVAGADTSVLFAVETTVPEDPIELSQMGQHVTMKLSGHLAGEQVYSLVHSAHVRSSMGGTMKINVGAMTMSLKQQTSLQLAEAE